VIRGQEGNIPGRLWAAAAHNQRTHRNSAHARRIFDVFVILNLANICGKQVAVVCRIIPARDADVLLEHSGRNW